MNKPKFESLSGGVTPVRVNDRIYNASPRGSGNFHVLRGANYGEGYAQGTFGDQLTLAHASYFHKNNSDAKAVVETVQQLGISGNTSTYGGNDIIIVQNFPEVENGRIVMNIEELESLLSQGEYLMPGVRISKDRRVGSVLRNSVKKGSHSLDEIKNSLYSIVLTLDKEGSNMMADISDTTGKRAYFRVPAVGEITVPVLFEGRDRLNLEGDWNEFNVNGYSFGLRQ